MYSSEKGREMDFVGAINAGFVNYVNFRGVATRAEYWYWFLFTFLANLVVGALDIFVPTDALSNLFMVAIFLPSLSVNVRRLRDAGFSWTWLLSLIPGTAIFTGGLIWMIVVLTELGYLTDPDALTDPNYFTDAMLQELIADGQFVGSILVIFVGASLLLLSLLLVNIIFPLLPSKSFEQGNKRVLPKSSSF